jgi:hypothetical protein
MYEKGNLIIKSKVNKYFKYLYQILHLLTNQTDRHDITDILL